MAALVRLIVSAGGKMSAAVWVDAISTLAQASDTRLACLWGTPGVQVQTQADDMENVVIFRRCTGRTAQRLRTCIALTE